MSKKSRNAPKEISHRLSVGLSEKTYNELRELAEQHGESVASVIRLVIDKNLGDYLGTIRYIDREQGENILNVSMEISDLCRNILNNVRRIGINYNQELKLKNAENKYRSVMREAVGTDRMLEAKDEYDQAKAEIEQTCFNKDELYELLSDFEAAAKKMGEVIWLIQE